MRKLILSFFIVLTMVSQTIAQPDFRVKASNIILSNGSSPTELIIENSTKNIKGVLVNIGNGQTEFRSIQKLNDSTFVIGTDTITIGSSASNLQQVTDAGRSTTHFINADSGYYQRNLPILLATDSLLRVGYHAGESNTTGGGNTAVGNSASQNNTTGYHNTAAGYHAIQQNTTGFSNVAVGADAMMLNSSGSGNVAVGRYSLSSNTTGSNNVGIGTAALGGNSTGSENTALGYNAAALNTTGDGITAIGAYALEKNTSGLYNTALGFSALNYNITGSRNTAVGHSTLSNTSGNDNTAIGKNAGSYASLSGGETQRNTAVGSEALDGANGNQNTAVGAGALTTRGGFNNTAVGDSALYAVYNSGVNNTAVGKNAGGNIVDGSNNIAIGYRAYVPGANDVEQLSVGNLIYGTGVNGVENNVSNGKVGIKTKTPAYEMDVNGKMGVRTIDSVSSSSNVICQDPATGEIKKAPYGNKQSFIQTATTVINSTAVETTVIGAGTGSLVIPASAWVTGKSFRIVVRGNYTTSASNPPSMLFKIKLGNTVLAQSPNFYPGSSNADVPYEIRADFTCRSTGASGSVFTMGFIRTDGEYVYTIDNGINASTVDLSANQTLNITAQLSNNTTGNSISTYIVNIESIN